MARTDTPPSCGLERGKRPLKPRPLVPAVGGLGHRIECTMKTDQMRFIRYL